MFSLIKLKKQLPSIYQSIKLPILDKLELIIERQIVFNKNLDIDFYVNQKKIEPELLKLNNLEYPLNVNIITETIECFDSKKVCQGRP